MSRVMFHSDFDPLPRKPSLRGLAVIVATVVVGTALAVHGFVESTLAPRATRPAAVEAQVLEPPSWMQEEAVPVQRASIAARRRPTAHTTCPIGGPASVSLSSRSQATPTQVVPAALPPCSVTGAQAGAPAGLSSGLTGS